MSARRAAAPLAGALLAACSAASPNDLPYAAADASAEDAAPLFDTAAVEGSITCKQDGGSVVVTADQDWDHDGWTGAEGDCNDCDPNANPGAFDVAGNGLDEDCSGGADDEPSGCDTGLDLSGNDPFDGARAVGLCRVATDKPESPRLRNWGVLSAAWQLADGTEGMSYASHGVLPGFGPRMPPQEGASLLVLSSATARRPSDPAYQAPDDADMKTSCATPEGWPKSSPSCPGEQSTTPVANDSASLALRIRVPTNARSLSLRFAFFTSEFPAYVCKQYNDFFVALLNGDNVSFDNEGNPISVNSAFLAVCTPQVAGGRAFPCLLGSEGLIGTGFDASKQEPKGHAGTGWLKTTASVMPGEDLSLRLIVWDSGDHLRGSTVLVDALQFEVDPATAPVTEPVK